MNAILQPWVCARCARSSKQLFRPLTKLLDVSRTPRAYTTEVHPQDDRSFRMAVIGSGPAGFYTAYKVMSRIENSRVDMYEQLPVPFGLVRFGVAPDHPEVKNCQDKFEEVAESPRFTFVGNVPIGEEKGSLPLRSLLPHYDAIVYAYGASRDRELGIPGENSLHGIYSARAFVGWYNGLPEYSGLSPDLSLGEEATVIGQGNVALDVARILLQDPKILRSTDITEHAIEALQKSKVKRVRLVGRRGAMQAAFTIKEARELMNLQAVGFHPVDGALIPEDIKKLPRPSKRIMELLKKGSSASVSTSPKSWSLDFCLSPTSFRASETSPTDLGSIEFEKQSLSPDPFTADARPIGTGERLDITSSLAFRSIGYKSEALPGFESVGIPFNNSLGIIPNDRLGRVLKSPSDQLMPGTYCAGWVKRGPTGVIASTMEDAFSTAESISKDWYGNVAFLNPTTAHCGGWNAVREEAQKHGCRRVSWQDWKKIDAVEKKKGQLLGKEREKFTKLGSMLAVLD